MIAMIAMIIKVLAESRSMSNHNRVITIFFKKSLSLRKSFLILTGLYTEVKVL